MQFKKLVDDIINGYNITKEEALKLYEAPLDLLKENSSLITEHFFSNAFELCCISNGKCGKCSEDCKFCAQSRFYKTNIQTSPLKSVDELYKEAKLSKEQGIHRFSVVTAGVRLSKAQIAIIAQAFLKITTELNMPCCGSLGLLDTDDFKLLKASGMTRYHNNIESSPNYFKQICTTHTFEDKKNTIFKAKECGLDVCSGCILGMGESIEDRIDIALTLKELNIKSVPINILNPIKGTPLENNKPLSLEEIKRTVAVFRHVLPNSVLRLAGGRLQIYDKYSQLFDFGINAQITGDLLTTKGITVANDVSTVTSFNKKLQLIEPKD